MLGRIAGYWKAKPSESEASAPDVVLYTRVPVPDTPAERNAVPAVAASNDSAAPPKPKKRSLADIKLSQLGLLPPPTIRRLNAQQIRSAADFVQMASDALQPDVSAAKVQRLQRAVRMSHVIDAMKPWHALVLFAIHRRSPGKLAGESIGGLHRDLKRFAWSSPGQKMFAGRPQPSAATVERWIESARARQDRRSSPRQAA